MINAIRTLLNVAVGLWIGVQVCIGFVVAPYLFALAAKASAAVPHTGVAAELIGPLLHGADLASLVVCIVATLGLLGLRGAAGPNAYAGARWWLGEAGLAVAFVCAATNYFMLSPKILAVKAELAEKYGAYHLADKTDALYKQFGQFHGISTLVFMIGLGAAMLAWICVAHRGSLASAGPLGATARVG